MLNLNHLQNTYNIYERKRYKKGWFFLEKLIFQRLLTSVTAPIQLKYDVQFSLFSRGLLQSNKHKTTPDWLLLVVEQVPETKYTYNGAS